MTDVEADLTARLDKARVEYRSLLGRVKHAEAELRKKTNLIEWVIACLGGDPTPPAPMEGEAAEAEKLKCWVEDVQVIASSKVTDHVKRLTLLIDVARNHPSAMGGRLAPGAAAEDWVRILNQIRTHLTESGVDN